MTDLIEQLIERAKRTQHGFIDIRRAADEVLKSHSAADSLQIAYTLFRSEAHQARMLAVFLMGDVAHQNSGVLDFLRQTVSRDSNWRVQEILAQAFDAHCANIGYDHALPVIQDWLLDTHPNVRRAVSEGLRIWTARSYFRGHPDAAVQLLSAHKDDESEYVRKSVGNALRDISRQHRDLVQRELETWDLSDKRIRQTHKLASKLLTS